MAVELPIFIILYILSKPGGYIDTRYNIYFLSLVVAIFQNQVAILFNLFILCCVCPWVWGHLGVRIAIYMRSRRRMHIIESSC